MRRIRVNFCHRRYRESQRRGEEVTLQMEPHGYFVLPALQFDFDILRPMTICMVSTLSYWLSRRNHD